MKKFLAVIITFMALNNAQAETNIRVSPLSVLVGVIDVEVDFKIADAWTLGPQLSLVSRTDGTYDVSGYKVGVRGNYWFNGAALSQGWYFGPSVSLVSINVKDSSPSSSLEGDATALGLVGIFGYQWMWESFNINLGAGPALISIDDVTITDSSGNKTKYDANGGVNLAIEFNLGWKF